MDSSQLKKFVAVAASCTALTGVLLMMKRLNSNHVQTLYNYQKRKKRIIVCRTHFDWSKCQDILIEECKQSRYLGLDCEWVTKQSTPQKVALLQLATESGTCVLLRLSHMGVPLPKSLIDVLNDISILKVGVACNDDALKLKKDYDIDVNGCVDLRHLITQYPISSINIPTLGLKGLANHVLGFQMKKDWRIQCGNWEAECLTDRQVDYAVQDAVVAVDIFNKIMKTKVLQSGVYRWLSYRFNKGELDISKYWKEIYTLCQPFINLKFKDVGRSKSGSPAKQTNNSTKSYTQTRAYSSTNKICYENIPILAPDGEVLCMCNEDKARWYLSKNRAVLVQKDPLVVQLNFEPKGRPILDGKFYTQARKNICVACGTSNSLLKRHIVPHEYRRFFPEILKNRSSHDVVLLCISCLINYNRESDTLRSQLALKCNAPIGAKEEVKMKENPEMKKVKSAARAILNHKDSLPEQRLVELTEILCHHFNISEPINQDILTQCAELDTRMLNTQYVSHGEKVTSYYSSNDGLLEFQVMWRQHFIDSMNPQFLANLWSTVHGHEVILLKLEKMEDSLEKEKLHAILFGVNSLQNELL